jgi:WD40 repeat protein
MEGSSSKIDNKIIKFFLGSYEGKIYAVDIDLKEKIMKNTFAFKVSENSLRVLYTKDQYIFASGVDEIVHIYDMAKREDKGMFVTYSGTINTLQIVKGFFFAAGDEPTISIWRMSDFNLIHTLKGHKKGITHFAVHKTGKFCVSTAKDSNLIIWDLITGIKIIKYSLKNLMCHKILFLKSQKHVAIIFDLEVWIFDLLKNSENKEEWVKNKIKVDKKIFDAFVVKENLVLIHNDGEVKVYQDATNSEKYKKFLLDIPVRTDSQDLDIRIKLVNMTSDTKRKLLNCIFTNSEIYIYDLNKLIKREEKDEKVKKFMRFNLKTSDRITCINTQI